MPFNSCVMIKTMKRGISFAVFALACALCFISYGCVQQSGSSNESDGSVIAAKQTIKTAVEAENQMCPIDFHNGVVYTSVSYDDENNVVTYKYSTNSFESFDNGENYLKESMLGMLVVGSDDEASRTFLEAVVKSQTKLVYSYKKDGDTREVVILPSDLTSHIPQLQK